MTIGKLERVALREVFPHEAYDLTRWLAENEDVLGDAIGQKLAISASEDRVGSFIADLIGEDESGDIVVVENQLGRSDHDHLGKLVTYASGTDARIAIWIVSDARPEHIQAVTWLNEANLCSFYLFKLEAVRIGDSLPAPLLTLVTGPSEELIQSGKTKKEQGERHRLRQAFWEALLPISNDNTPLFRSISAGDENYLIAGAGKSGCIFAYRLVKYETSVELNIDTPDLDYNRSLFERLYAERDQIEREFGEPLEWVDTKRRARQVRKRFDGGYRTDPAEWPLLHQALAETMARFERAIRAPLERAFR